MIFDKLQGPAALCSRALFWEYLGLFQGQGDGGGVADFAGPEVLDGTGVDIVGLHGPGLPVGGEEGEGLAVQLHQSLADDGLVRRGGARCSSSW